MDYFLVSLIKIAVVFGAFMTTLAYLQWIERKVLAHIQLRLGPQRVGPHGLLQPLADVIKLATKEGVIPANVNTFFYVLAPFLAVSLALISISVIPFGPAIELFGVRTNLELASVNISVLLILAISSVGVYGIALGGWASNNKYSLMGGLRSSAQMISYELPMAISLVTPLLVLNTLDLRQIAERQAGGWFWNWAAFSAPPFVFFAFIVFLIAAFAETNRIPFDLPEAENELVAGFHTEYSSLAFAGFFMAEYANMVTITCVATTVFLGGWHPPFPAPYSNFVPTALFWFFGAVLLFHGLMQPARRWDRFTFPIFGIISLGLGAIFLVAATLLPIIGQILLPVFWFVAKVGVLLFIFIWIRGTLPRFRYDQLMRFTWTFLFPVALGCLLLTGLWVAIIG